MTDLRKLIDEGLSLCERATPGPWRWGPADYDSRTHAPTGVDDGLWASDARLCTDGSARGEYSPDIDVAGADAKLIAYAGTHLRTLLTALRDYTRLADDNARIGIECEDSHEKLEKKLRDQDAALRGLVEELRREASSQRHQASLYLGPSSFTSILESEAAAKESAADRIEKIREGKS